MQLQSRDIADGEAIDPRFAFAKPDPDSHMTLSDNLSPQLAWSGAPEGTRSYAIVCMDPDVPSEADDVNQEGKSLPADMPRVDFCHWSMVEVPKAVNELTTGECCDGITPKGKRNPPGPEGTRQGLNDYTDFLAGDPDMAGHYAGYDGPCPPWNDERLHHYVFTVYALDTDRLDLPESFNGHDVVEAIDGHVLDQASITGTYTLNPAVSG
ncbi:MAG: YbhB/YbcL family Raf kinase inhibitor-like protein [Gammaproteobacteria bacterium]|jgi:Raf kinase inhibitor-like YbhB/YbcL family protein|nr:YbhB/YbcL family Raf kinase inhibitor-like protein [Gammaproteobacteria bacterium]